MKVMLNLRSQPVAISQVPHHLHRRDPNQWPSHRSHTTSTEQIPTSGHLTGSTSTEQIPTSGHLTGSTTTSTEQIPTSGHLTGPTTTTTSTEQIPTSGHLTGPTTTSTEQIPTSGHLTGPTTTSTEQIPTSGHLTGPPPPPQKRSQPVAISQVPHHLHRRDPNQWPSHRSHLHRTDPNQWPSHRSPTTSMLCSSLPGTDSTLLNAIHDGTICAASSSAWTLTDDASQHAISCSGANIRSE
ncbi:hypothetical protein CgunFtcFv8_018204 [Champsocephalus gunnari]|uniref:Uncharacterized protein n=1 Tax=Champsocephalus gunnari TaxID=52237 RepID=A0AAN8DP71_CHAGU|nr:hypothetical protein CgunFtcFv8_018204 [Champsocephalus gunnari]